MRDLTCPMCGHRISSSTLTSMPPMYEGECADKCGFAIRYFERKDPFQPLSQREMDVHYATSLNKKLDTAKAELKECYELFKKGDDAMSVLTYAVTTLNGARHDGNPMHIIAAYNGAFNACNDAAKVLTLFRAKTSLEEDLWKKL